MRPKMFLKAAALLTALSASASVSERAQGALPSLDSPLFILGDRACGYFLFETGATWTDNIFASKFRVDDMIYSVSPGIAFDIGRESMNQINLGFRETFINYMNHDRLGTQLANGWFNWTCDPQGRARFNISATFTQVAQNDSTLYVPDDESTSIDESRLLEGQILRRDLYFIGGTMSYALTAKLNTDFGFNWSHEDYVGVLKPYYNDRQVYSPHISVHREIFDKYYLGVSYNYSFTDINGHVRQYYGSNPGYAESHFVGLSTKGILTAKLSLRGNIGVGWNWFDQRIPAPNGTTLDYAKGRTYSTLNFTLAADYVSDKWRATLSTNRQFMLNGQAQAYTNTNARINFQAWLNHKISYYAFFGYAYMDFVYFDRVDHVITFGGGFDYHPNRYWRIGIGYYGIQDLSTGKHPISDFYANSLTISASLKY